MCFIQVFLRLPFVYYFRNMRNILLSIKIRQEGGGWVGAWAGGSEAWEVSLCS